MIEFENVRFHYPKRDCLFNFNFQLSSKKTHALAGMSGCGKTTLLYLAGGFLFPASGRIRFNGIDVQDYEPKDRQCSFMFQENNLFAHLTLMENLAMGIRGKLNPGSYRKNILNILEEIGLGGLDNETPSFLSGGQKQRAAIARCLLRASFNETQEGYVLLLDEPFAGIDAATQNHIRKMLRHQIEKKNVTLLYTVHEKQNIMLFADSVIILKTKNGQTEVVEQGTPDLLNRDKNSVFFSTE